MQKARLHQSWIGSTNAPGEGRVRLLLVACAILAVACASPTTDGGADAALADAAAPDAARPDAAVVSCEDPDGDGYGPDCAPGRDCRPDDASAHPGTGERCNGVDDNCDDVTDEGCACEAGAVRPCGTSVGACTPGEQRCDAGAWGSCEGALDPADEACDGIVDDDCDGVVDEGCACVDGATTPCGSDVGACRAGARTCVGGALGECAGAVGPAAEACDGAADDDCDGTVDEGCECVEGATRACGSDVGACAAGVQACAGGAWGACEGATSASTEACDGVLDEDCDAIVDEGCACVDGETRACGSDVGACAAGSETCAGGAWGACREKVGPEAERCDGTVDEDCDGIVDEGCECTDGATRACGSDVGACAAGTQTCATGFWGTCTEAVGAEAERCDGTVDEDCDGMVDEGCECTDGATRACGSDVGACAPGTETCSGGRWAACAGGTPPSTEVCELRSDEDCDGAIDEGCDCRTSGCALGWCDSSAGTCDTTAPGYAVHYWSWLGGPLAMHVRGPRVWLGEADRRVLWGEATTSGVEALVEPAGRWALSGGVALTDDPSGTMQWIAGLTDEHITGRTGAHIGAWTSGPRHTEAFANYSVRDNPLRVRARYHGAELYALFVDSEELQENLNLLVESAGAVTQTALPPVTESGFFEPADVDFLVDAAGHVEVLLVGHRGSPFEALAFLIDWDPAAGAYRQRRFVVDTISLLRPEFEIGGAFDRDGTPTMVVARADDSLSRVALYRFISGAWVREDLPDLAHRVSAAGVAFNAGNRPVIGLVRADGSMQYVRETALGSWASDVVVNPHWSEPECDLALSVRDLEVGVDDDGRAVFAFTGTCRGWSAPVFPPLVGRGTYLFVPTP